MSETENTAEFWRAAYMKATGASAGRARLTARIAAATKALETIALDTSLSKDGVRALALRALADDRRISTRHQFTSQV